MLPTTRTARPAVEKVPTEPPVGVENDEPEKHHPHFVGRCRGCQKLMFLSEEEYLLHHFAPASRAVCWNCSGLALTS